MQKIGLLCLIIFMLLFLGHNTTKYNKVVRTTTPIHAVAKKPIELDRKEKVQLVKVQTTIKKEESKYSEQDLFDMTCVVFQEAGSNECSDEMQRLVGNVVINRVNHIDFSNSIHEVLIAKYQYGNMWRDGVKLPSDADKDAVKRCEENAKYILEGNRVCPANVVYESEFSWLGDGVYRKFKTKQGFYYFNYKA